MSELTPEFFSRLAQKLPGMKAQIGEAIKKSRLKRNGPLVDGEPPCQICGEKFSVKTQVILQTEHPIQHCPRCQEILDKGGGAFVTVEKKARFWIGFGVQPALAGKVKVVSSEEMDAIERMMDQLAHKKLEEDESARAYADFLANMHAQGKVTLRCGDYEATPLMSATEKQQWEDYKLNWKEPPTP